MCDYFVALTYPFRGVAHFFGRPSLWKYAAVAIAIHLVALAAAVALYLRYRAGLVEALTPDRFPHWFRTASHWLFSLLILVGALFGGLLAGNLMSLPALDALTERILRDLGEALPPGRGARHAVWRSCVNQTLKLLIFGAIQGALLLLYLTPLAVLHPPLSSVLGILFLGFNYLDYPLDARRLPVLSRFAWLLRHPGATLGYGSGLFLVLLVPLLGMILLPLAVAGAALLAHRLDSPAPTG